MEDGTVATDLRYSVIEMNKPLPFVCRDDNGNAVLVVRTGKTETDLPSLIALLQNREFQVKPR